MAEEERNQFQSILDGSGSKALFKKSLKLLTSWLFRLYKKRVIVLIDEYDTPIHSSYLHGYYELMIEFMRGWFTSGLKDNACLEKAVLTGILRVSKESIFSGLNNLGCYTLLRDSFGDKFGLLEEEVSSLLKTQGISYQIEEVRRWYNGYRIGPYLLYNPWSILQCIDHKGELQPYWVNTSDNQLIRNLLIHGGVTLKKDLERLLEGDSVTKSIREDLVFTDLDSQSDAVFGLFLFSGYLTLDAKPVYEEGSLQCQLKVPNQEIVDLYKTIITEWMMKTLPEDHFPLLLESLTTGDVETFAKMLQILMINSMSFYDMDQEEPEKVYHAFVLGLLVTLSKNYEVKSNRESGFGRYDVSVIPKDPSSLGIIMEFKKVDREEDLEKGANDALRQIEKKQYAMELKSRNVNNILTLGLAFHGKRVCVKKQVD